MAIRRLRLPDGAYHPSRPPRREGHPMSRHVTILALLTAGLLESGCGFQHATPRGPLASVADSIGHAARRIDCETPDHRSFGDIDYRICSTETGNALYDVDREGRILSTAESWAADS